MIDWDALLQVIWISFVAGIGVTAAVASAIVSAARLTGARRGGRAATVAGYGALLLISGALVAAAMVGGLLIIVN